MASIGEQCQFCHCSMDVPRKGWRLRSGSYAKLCVPCASAYEDGTFCHIYHGKEDGWRNCDECEKKFHCGCIMSFHLFETNDMCGVTCKECVGKKTLVVSNRGSSSPVPLVQLDDSCYFPENVVTGVELLACPAIGKACTSEDPVVECAVTSTDPSIGFRTHAPADGPQLKTKDVGGRLLKTENVHAPVDSNTLTLANVPAFELLTKDAGAPAPIIADAPAPTISDAPAPTIDDTPAPTIADTPPPTIADTPPPER